MIRSGDVQFHDSLAPLMRPVEGLKPHPSNPKNGDVDAIVESIRTSGFYRPIYINANTQEVLAGNHSLAAALSLGATQVPVVELDVTPNAARKILLADNRTADLGKYDHGQLVELLEHLATEDDITGTGYEPDDLEQLKALSEMEFDAEDVLDFAQWPTLSIQVPPHIRDAFYKMTDEAGSDRDRFEVLLRLAGWEGKWN